ncbi:MAG: zf-HC2 domain-containing protein [Micrococcales bacterium]
MSEDMTCVEIKQKVHEYLFNELTTAQLDYITEHIANCDTCDAEYGLEDAINRKIEEFCQSVPSVTLLDGIKERIRQIEAGEAH